jgi:integrase/recombinase XerD
MGDRFGSWFSLQNFLKFVCVLSELMSLNWDALQERGNGNAQITVIGKRDKMRAILLSEGTYKELLNLKTANSKEHDPILQSNWRRRISVRMIQVIVDQARLRAGITRRVSPHWLRHGHASHSLDRGAPIHLVQSTLGHTSPRPENICIQGHNIRVLNF